MCVAATCFADAEKQAQTNEVDPWIGKYPMSFFTKTRSANTVGKDHLSVALKVQHWDWDQVRNANGGYDDRTSGQSKEKLGTVLCTKYGWAKDHHLAVGVPVFFNDFDIPGKTNDHSGLGNVFLFEKWKCIKETNTMPGVALDFWYYLRTGDTDKKLGRDDGAYKVTAEISKAWEKFSVHVNPGYTWIEGGDFTVDELNVGVILNANPKFLPAVEYNYFHKEHAGCRHDVVPGFIWKFMKGWSLKLGCPITVDSTMTDKDEIAMVLKLFKKW